MPRPIRMHWKKTDSVDAACGRYGSTVTFADDSSAVTCRVCLRRMPPSPFTVLENIALTEKPQGSTTEKPQDDTGYMRYLVETYPNAEELLLKAIFGPRKKTRRLQQKPRTQSLTRKERGTLGTRTRRRTNTKHRRHRAIPGNYHHKLTGR